MRNQQTPRWRHRPLSAVPAAALLAMTGAWSQPPEAPPPRAAPPRLPVDQLGWQPQLPPQVVFGRDGMTMQMLTPGGAGQQGALALSEKYVFVLLDGQLYQYDIDTLALRNQARVAPPAGVAQVPFAVRVEPRPPVMDVSCCS